MNAMIPLKTPVLGPPVLSAELILAEAAMECGVGYCCLDLHLEACLKRVAEDKDLSRQQRARALWFLCRMG